MITNTVGIRLGAWKRPLRPQAEEEAGVTDMKPDFRSRRCESIASMSPVSFSCGDNAQSGSTAAANTRSDELERWRSKEPKAWPKQFNAFLW
jgi:hypothetical protein